ncbi:UMP-CMP kinase 2 [Chelonia mydas]|uniref:UMP-CMP kinase 2 n=1 Tax=Chelonia mydas TaxID=8469 RepID=M7CLG8_CHEMY|nr:UMP-CMP kinase 2 [Chelonia mydas]
MLNTRGLILSLLTSVQVTYILQGKNQSLGHKVSQIKSGYVQAGGARVVAAEEPPLHPAVPGLRHAAVFLSLEAARSVVEQCTSLIPEATAVLDLVDKCPKHSKKGDFPVIVIEGLDATGPTPAQSHWSTTYNNPPGITSCVIAVFPLISSAELQILKETGCRSPPACISQWRKTFDDEPTLIRRAFYALGNYIVASEIAKASTESPVVVDRYWHSTAAYAIATEISGKVQNLPPTQHEVYQWPEDLLKPDLVLLLTVSPEERIRRLQGRGLEKTEEETELEANSLFRQKYVLIINKTRDGILTQLKSIAKLPFTPMGPGFPYA